MSKYNEWKRSKELEKIEKEVSDPSNWYWKTRLEHEDYPPGMGLVPSSRDRYKKGLLELEKRQLELEVEAEVERKRKRKEYEKKLKGEGNG